MSTVFTAQTTIARPASEVWDALTDWDRAQHWMPGVDSLKADGPTEVGTVLSFHSRGKDRPSRIVAVDQGESVVLQSKQGGVTAEYHYRIEPVSVQSATVKLVASCTTTPLWSVVGPMLRAAMRRTDGKQLDNLKQYLESGA